MRYSYHFICIISSIFLIYFVGFAHATLMSTSNSSVIYDDINNQYWISDLTLLTNLTYQEQLSTINEWNENGTFASDEWSDFRMATVEDVATYYYNYEYSFGQYQDLFTSNYSTGDGEGYHGRTSSQINSVIAPYRHRDVAFQWWTNENWLYYEDCGEYSDSFMGAQLGAWVVATPVPEPMTALLFVSGIIGICWVKIGQNGWCNA